MESTASLTQSSDQLDPILSLIGLPGQNINSEDLRSLTTEDFVSEILADHKANKNHERNGCNGNQQNSKGNIFGPYSALLDILQF